ncbi:oxidoreductase [Pholiota conissans]|uniref:Oxidoreductase n=1 Tax=Pholiota conissans TaxID=109636 RepID=A0A9P5ZBT2_9AGAR|nr:oxidoreductase [Pholiota conissans]
MFGLFSKKWNPDGKHVYITGGSSGLGLSLAHILAQKGANVSIVARNQKKLDEALESLEKLRVSPAQKFHVYSHALGTGAEATAALDAVCEPYDGEAPDAVFTCAGSSKPMFFVEMDEQDMVDGMTNAYWLQAWTAWAAAKKMAKEHKKGAKIVLVSSTLGYMSFVGWASYSPGKHALRGLADSLHSELMLYGIDVHIYFPATMYTPGFDEENKTKPDIVKRIESTDEGCTAEQAAQALYKGVVKGHAHITGDLITSLFSAGTRGAAPRNNWLLEALFDMVAFIAVPVWRHSVDNQVRAHREEHEQYLQQKGFFS